ncbi:tRNA (adenosine(37)-N6)-dimethylallyltransferase MiaA [Planomicrobium sp. MB-3u-38]|uniref:tRNA (adenosine(37)-N6)-dimethylallyltransferase MiaA n=1 Tax=Planomicrobium sp. MB-3u-38 TaxID=2058318 RepID=UPI000C7AC14A|nr:tRNA (adenosine(37)-N6)-dimethylallyltransferase MiaA [Planomicrobium sp. MB-3u-38]PKH09930.1 tRNA (adenosine(37)-N6)-dimethylallyltransferase MiaA [Planomicrobium sp. MB-3u-38]
MIEVMAIVGPTASGKTALGIELAKAFNGEIINGDSMQIYRDMSIGTAKVKPEEMAGVTHHLLDIKDPEEPFSVAEYQKLVRDKISEIKQKGKLPIIVGGTGLYIQAVLFDYRFSESQVDENLRNELYTELEEFGPLHMHEKLMQLDPETDIHPNNTRRVVRALEIILGSEQKVDRSLALEPMYNELIVGIDIPRALLYERIDRRVDAMMEDGLIREVEALRERGIRDVQSIQAIGYKEIYAYLDGKLEFDRAIELLKKNSRNYAKRQLTYFRNKLPVFWIDGQGNLRDNIENIRQIMQENDRGRRIELIGEQKPEQGK